MNDKNQKKSPNQGPLEKGINVPPGNGDSKNDNCEEILKIIHRNGGLPVTINASRIIEEHRGDEFNEIKGISHFIKRSRIDFNVYKGLMDDILLCRPTDAGPGRGKNPGKKDGFDGTCKEPEISTGLSNAAVPDSPFLSSEDVSNFRNGALFSSSKSYSILKYATEKFVHTYLGLDPGDIPNPSLDVLPYISLIEAKLQDIQSSFGEGIQFRPLFSELIWNYWHEEGMLVHTINAIARRFQNKRSHRGNDPLANLDLDPLRPINNLIWGYIQDSINRLTPTRRAFEYDHEYGLSLFAAGATKLRSADSRSFFIQAFHNLLYKCAIFYTEADNLFKVPDAFPVLNALREVHLLLSEGAGSQFGDLPITARSEMLLEQYMLSRPEIREFLGGRVMVPYDEPWMDRVDTMKAIQGWPGASISYYRDLAKFGEEIILSIRWISWSQVNHRDFAREWALIFRDAIQRYLHCYHAVTGVDLSAIEISGGDEKSIMPALLIGRKAQRDLMMRKR